MTSPRILVAGIGNIFLGDDGFGVEVVNRLSRTGTPPGVHVLDVGIRGLHLAYELLDGYDVLILVDAMPMGEAPGTVAILEPDLPVPSSPNGGDGNLELDAHSMNPLVVLDMLAALGGSVPHIRVVGCQPATLAEGIGLSPTVAAAVDPALALVGEVLARFEGAFS